MSPTEPMPEESIPVEARSLELEKFEFEKQRHNDDIAVKRRELELQQKHMEQSAWRSPLFLAVVAAIFGLLSNALVALINGSSERTLEKGKSETAQTLAKQKAEADRILEALKTGDPDKAAANLDLLVRTNLVKEQAQSIRSYLDQRKPGEGASLPAPTVSGINPRFGGIVGFDDRIQINDVGRAPFRSICLVKLSNDWSSGFLIHPRIVVVPRYAIQDSELDSTVVYVAPRSSTPTSGGVKPTEYIRRETGDDTLNYAYLILPESASANSSDFVLPDTTISNEEIANAELHFAGYPGDLRGLAHNVGNAADVPSTHVYHLLDTGRGAGGGPIWMQKGNRHIVVAVHLATAAGNSPGKIALRLIPEEVEQIVQSISQ